MQGGFHEFLSRCEGSDTTGERNFGKLTLKDLQKLKVDILTFTMASGRTSKRQQGQRIRGLDSFVCMFAAG